MIYFVVIFVAAVLVWYIWHGDSQPTQTQYDLAAKMFGSPQSDEPATDYGRVLEEQCARIEAMIQADETGHHDIRQQIEADTYQGPLPERRNDGGWTSIFDELRILSIAGINHRDGIVRYTGRNTIALVPEPKNEFDPQAIKVVAEDGHHLGYIRRDQTDMVRSWARDEFPMYCTCRIEQHEDDGDGHRFYTGFIYLLKKL